MRQVVERNPAGPLRFARPSRRWQARPSPLARIGNASRRVVADVAGDVGVDEVLRRDDEIAERLGELGSSCAPRSSQERGQRGVVGVERGPAECQRLERRCACLAGMRRRRVVRVDRVGHQRTVARDADVEADGRVALDAIVSGMTVIGSCSPRNSASVPAGSSRSRIQILDVGRHVGGAPGDEPIAAERDRRRAGQRRADHIEVAGRDVREIPGRGQPRAEMRIVGEQRLAAGRQRAVDDPVVRAERFCSEPPRAGRGDGGQPVRQSG